ncbi:complex I subunit 5 family protein [Roseicella frigidaeris]|uniref:NADH-quinone oxidoreductase subunit J n=1 Tax=Roseicella frigidaeris TaxID=2230885 RepID=A0A327M9P8_9PROT|nr:proton-conducting transporter membrane subunit [Roseicella frigidaeris]RAI59207.1 NADH-quinone oxidoreductase subunit J [Roseicella frigidaeris]
MTATTPAGWLLVVALVLPVAGMLLAFVLGGRAAERLALLLLGLGVGVGVAVSAAVLRMGAPIVYLPGGWAPPLGLALVADGVAAAMLLTTALVLFAVALFGRAAHATPPDQAETRAALAYWCFLLALAGSLAAAFLGGDLFNLFVALEMLTFAALSLACLEGKPSQFRSELRYLLFALIGSVLYLLGTALLYGGYGTLDFRLLAGRTRADLPTLLAAALMTAGLAAKMALFPLHLWLPPAHAGAPPAASALLSGLVVKAAFVLLLRVWIWVLPPLPAMAAAPLLAALGAAAILVGSLVALRQARLKLLVAYSTVAQIGYLFLMLPLVLSGAAETASHAWLGGLLQAGSHAFAKAAMFLAAGLIATALGHDRVTALGGAGQAVPRAVFAFGLAGLSLMGIPPSGGFTAKWLLLTSALGDGQWWWAAVILGGGLLTGGYVYRVLAGTIAAPPGDAPRPRPLPHGPQNVALGLALISVALGLLPLASFGLVQIGRPGALGALP